MKKLKNKDDSIKIKEKKMRMNERYIFFIKTENIKVIKAIKKELKKFKEINILSYNSIILSYNSIPVFAGNIFIIDKLILWDSYEEYFETLSKKYKEPIGVFKLKIKFDEDNSISANEFNVFCNGEKKTLTII